MSVYADISLPLPLKDCFCYEIPPDFVELIVERGRVIVPFGAKTYTGIILKIHTDAPIGYKVKQIYQVIDTSPILNINQIDFYKWLARYYLISLGEVIKTALPAHFFLESRAIIQLQDSWNKNEAVSNEEFLIIEALQKNEKLRIEEVQKIVGEKKAFKILDSLIIKNIIILSESYREKYKPKLEAFLIINPDFISNKEKIKTLLETLKQSPKQKEIILSLFSMSTHLQKEPIHVRSFLEKHNLNRQQLRELERKKILFISKQPVDRIQFTSKDYFNFKSEENIISKDIQKQFEKEKPVLFYGSNFRENLKIHVDLIGEYLKKQVQILLLLPENFSTIQFINYLKEVFPSNILAYHAKMSQNERIEIWSKILNWNSQSQIVIGTKLALFLPFSNLKLVIVEDEQVLSYKQSFTNFKYHCRDSAIVLAKNHGANILLTSSTPSIESFYNASKGKYTLITSNESPSNHKFEVVDFKEALRRKQIKGHFSNILVENIEKTLHQRKKIILFQNRRGYSPSIQCRRCGTAIYCPHCDVTLTYYKSSNQLKCHYCNYSSKKPNFCLGCGGTDLQNKGLGTEQLEQEVRNLFPSFKVARLDYDTTRKKNSFLELITEFKLGKVDILIGTQILNSGIDFKNVGLLGIVNLESLLSFPDFRVNEQAYQLIEQLSTRTVADQEKSKVMIQAYDPNHELIKILKNYSYEMFYSREIKQRQLFSYPPYVHLTKITFKNRQENRLDICAEWFSKHLKKLEGVEILGPSLPPVSKVKNEYFRDILIKHNLKNIHSTKDKISKLIQLTTSIDQFRSIKIIADIDCY